MQSCDSETMCSEGLSEGWCKLCCCSFQVVGAVKEKALWPKVLVETRGVHRIEESIDEQREHRDAGIQRGM